MKIFCRTIIALLFTGCCNFYGMEQNNNQRALYAMSDEEFFRIIKEQDVSDLPPLIPRSHANSLQPEPPTRPISVLPNPSANLTAAKNKQMIVFNRPPLGPPTKKKKSLLDEDDEDEDYIPFTQIQAIKVAIGPERKSHLLVAESISKTLEKETLRKFTYDMEAIEILDPHAYATTIMILEEWRQRDKNFLYTLNIKNGTPDIIRSIESQTSYRFPENIVVRTKKYPYACSLAEVACCTESRVKEHKNALINQSESLPSDRDKIYKEIPSSSYLIEMAILTYLDQIKAIREETPEQRDKRIYKRAFEFLFAGSSEDNPSKS